MPEPNLQPPNASAVLTEAAARVAERLALPAIEGGRPLLPESPEWTHALLLVRAYLALTSLVGDEATARDWFRSENRELGARPVDLSQSTDGLARVVQYLDASLQR